MLSMGFLSFSLGAGTDGHVSIHAERPGKNTGVVGGVDLQNLM